ncbi:MAG: hypothetical protein ABI821_09520 [Pseudomonadota bacterium]
MKARHLFAATIAATAFQTAGCKPEQSVPTAAVPAPVAEMPVAVVTSSAVNPMLEACRITMSAPEKHEWTTYWNPKGVELAGEGPSHVHSIYWANAQEKASLRDKNTALPIDITCSSDGPPEVTISLAAFSSKEKDIPLKPGTYQIVGKSGAEVKPGEVLAGALTFNKGMYDATNGTLELEKFDMEGVKGSFTINGREALTGAKPIMIEGTFAMPCRGGLLESACKVNRKVARE